MTGCLKSTRDVGVVGPMTDIGFGFQNKEFAQSFGRLYKHRRIPARQVAGSCIMFKRNLVDDVGLFDEDMKSKGIAVEDFCLRTELVWIPQLDCRRRVYPKTRQQEKLVKKQIRTRIEIIEDKRRFDEKWEKIEQNSVLSNRLFSIVRG